MTQKIKLLHNGELDLEKWDRCVLSATNSRIYAESWYLDIIEPDWLGIVYGNYDYVMPVICAVKFGIRYAYQPAYVQQQGIFPPATPDITNQIIVFLKTTFPYFNISMNAYNVSVAGQVEIEYRKNFILPLKHDLSKIRANYTTHAKRYIKKSFRECSILASVSFEDYIDLKARYSQKSLKKTQLQKLKLLVYKCTQNQRAFIYGAYTRQNELCAAALFLTEEKRMVYLNSVSTPEGKEKRAMYGILDQFIADHAQMNYLLDFEGSNIEGIARFFRGFGAEAESYQHIKYNNLPWFLKLFKS